MTNLHLETAIRAAREGGAMLKPHLGLARQVKHKGKRDLVSELDMASQEAVIQTIVETFPDHNIMAEEKTDNPDLSGPVWIIDPLDGTTNFVHGLAYYCVSVALAVDGDLKVGVIYDPERDELFSALAGNGARLNGQVIAVSGIAEMIDSMLVTGFPYELETNLDIVLGQMKRVLVNSQGVRRLGSAALDLVHVASGRMEGFWEMGLNPWDIAAGVLIVQEAGGTVSHFDGHELDLFAGQICASNGHIHRELLAAIQD